MPHDARAIANWFLEKAKDQGDKLTNMKLQKLVYIAHGWNLALFEAPLVEDTIEAWQYGPVIPSLYHEFKLWGSGEIKELAENMFVRADKIYCVPYNAELNGEEHSLLDEIWKAYGKFSANQLSRLTHKDGSPWHQVWEEGCRNRPIPNNVIKAYYKKLAER